MKKPLPIDDLTADERIDLIGRLWDSLEPDTASPLTGELAAELARREAEADASPEDGEDWTRIRDRLRSLPL